MAKALVFLCLFPIAALAAALFGALHDQVSYTVSPDYYRLFKFEQFAIPDAWPDRLGAAWVGVLASWWMGPIVGLLPFCAGLLLARGTGAYLRAGLAAIAIVFALTALASFTGLLAEILLADPDPGRRWVPDGADRTAFRRAGAMHNAAYLGGAIGTLAALWPMVRARRRARQLP